MFNANGTIFLGDDRTIEIRDKLFTGIADSETAEGRKNSVFPAFLGKGCTVIFENFSNEIGWRRVGKEADQAIVEIDSIDDKGDGDILDGSSHAIRAHREGTLADVTITWQPNVITGEKATG